MLEMCMNTLRPERLFQLSGRLLIAAVLILMQFACSSNQDPAVVYDAGSNPNPAGPSAPNQDPLEPPNPNHPANWFTNGNLESGQAPWYAQGEGVSISLSSEQKHGGEYSLLVQGRTTSWHGPVMPVLKTLPAGRMYEASVWVRLAEGEEPTVIRLSMKVDMGEDGIQYPDIAQAEVAADGWTRLRGTFTHNPEGAVQDLTLYVQSDSDSVSFYVDDLTLDPLSNLITNGGVEEGVNPWRSQGPVMISQSSDQKHGGNYSLLITGRSGTWHAPVMDLPQLAAGRSYQASIWVRLVAGSPSSQLKLTLKRLEAGKDESEAEYLPLGESSVTADAWVQLSGVFTHVAEGVALDQLYLYVESDEAGANSNFYVDDLELALAAQNLVVNGDVESSLSGWGPFGPDVVLQHYSEDAYQGSHSVHVSNRNAEWQGAAFSVAPPQAGDLYQFSCWVKMAPANDEATVIMTIKLSDSVYIEVNHQPVTAADWVQLSGPYLHDPDGTETEFTPYIQASVATAEYLIDSCSVTPL
jgi:hypothetical protein